MSTTVCLPQLVFFSAPFTGPPIGDYFGLPTSLAPSAPPAMLRQVTTTNIATSKRRIIFPVIRLRHVGHLLHHHGILKRGVLHLLDQRFAGVAGERIRQLLRREHNR